MSTCAGTNQWNAPSGKSFSSSVASTSFRLMLGRYVFSRRLLFRQESNDVLQTHAY